MSLKCNTTEEMEFQLKPRLDAMKWAFSNLKEKSDNLGFYILGLSLTISCIESIKLVLGYESNKIFKTIPIVLSLGVGGLSAYAKKCNFNEKLELLLNSINDVTHILLDIRNADSITKEVAEDYTKALGIVEGATDPKSRGEFYKQASKNLISIQKQSLKYKAALDLLSGGATSAPTDPEIGFPLDSDTETDESPKNIKVVIDNKPKQDGLLLSAGREPVANKVPSVGTVKNKDGTG